MDETALNIQISRDYGWSHRGQQINAPIPAKGKNASLLCIIGIHGLAGWDYTEGSFKT